MHHDIRFVEFCIVNVVMKKEQQQIGNEPEDC